MYERISRLKWRIFSASTIALCIFLVGIIAIFISVTIPFFTQWPNFPIKVCALTHSFNYFLQMPIIQIIFITFLSLFTLCFLLCFLLSQCHHLNVYKLWHQNAKFRLIYPLLMGIGLVAGGTALGLAVKVLWAIQDFGTKYGNGQITPYCMTDGDMAMLEKRRMPLIVIIVLIGIGILLGFLFFIFLPYSYICKRQKEKYPKLQKIQQKPVQAHPLQSSHQQLLIESVKLKQFNSLGIQTNIQPPSPPSPPRLAQTPSSPKKPKTKQFGLGDNPILGNPIKKKEIGINSKIATNQIAIQAKAQMMNRQTDCFGLVRIQMEKIQQKDKMNKIEKEKEEQQVGHQISESKLRNLDRTQTKKVDPSLLTPRKRYEEGSDAMIIVEPELYGYYYLEHQKQHQQNCRSSKSSSKLEYIQDSGRKLYNDDNRSKYFISSHKNSSSNDNYLNPNSSIKNPSKISNKNSYSKIKSQPGYQLYQYQ